ncbi:MAG: serine hydrolase [Bacteroidota bacterium]|nr:serine hydrolase [Bacteroidota bacterium]
MKGKSARFLISVVFILFFSGIINAQATTEALPRSTPEKEGVSSKGILNFLDAIEKSNHEFHSFMFLRHGKVISEGWWKPYSPERKHTMYSLSKSFTSTAIGFAVSEKRLTVNDRVISFFPKELPDSISPNLASLRIKDLLSMSAGQDPEPTFSVSAKDSNWVKILLSLPIVHKPGTKFLYNTLATYMLSAIIQKVTKEKVVDYLRPRLFEPLGIHGMDWETDPMGINLGGWGLRIKTEDMAKFGQFYLQKGNWKGHQILPKEWIEEATTKKIDQSPEASQSKRDSSDWLQGYCYQFWRCRYNAFRGDGAYGQFIIVMPEQDAVVVITAESNNLQDEINLVWKYLLPAITNKELPADNKEAKALKEKLSTLSLPIAPKSADPATISAISGKIFATEKNDNGIQSLSFKFNNGTCQLIIKSDTAEYKINFSSGVWNFGETSMRGPDLFPDAKTHLAEFAHSKIAGSYNWKDEKTLELTLRYIESPHTERITCHFSDNKILVEIQKSSESKTKKAEIKGEIKQF